MRGRAVAAFVFASILSRGAWGSPEDLFGYGPHGPAMGATGTASARGFEATYSNPALLSLVHERSFSLGWQGATFRLNANGDGLPGRVPYAPAKGVLFGLAIPIPFGGLFQDRVAAGLAFYTPTDVLVRGRILYPETPQFSLLPDRSQILAVQLGLGADLGYGVRAGVGFSAVAQIEGSVVAATDATGHVGTRVEDQLIAVYAPVAGLSYDLPIGRGGRDGGRPFRVGLAYRGALAARFSVIIDGTKLSSLNIPLFNIAGLAQYDPAELAFEAAYDTPSWVVAAGVTYKRWSDYPGPLEPTILCPPDNPNCGALVPTHVTYSDTLVLRVGADRAVPLGSHFVAHARAGYFFEPSPLPSSLDASQAYEAAAKGVVAVPTRFFDATRHVLTLGGGIELSRPLPPLTIDLYGQLHLLAPRTETLHPAPGGDASSSSPADVSGSVLVGGMIVGVTF